MQSKFNRRSLYRLLGIAAAYLTIFVALDLSSTAFQSSRGVTVWYPSDGITLAFLLTFGPAFLPLPILASLISSYFVYGLREVEPLGLLVWAVGLSGLFALTAVLLKKRHTKEYSFDNQSAVFSFILATFLVALILAFFSVLALTNAGQSNSETFWHSVFDWWLGEIIGLLVITPFLLTVVRPLVRNRIEIRNHIRNLSSDRFNFLILACYLFFMWVVFISGFNLEFGLYYILFIPLFLATFRYGLRGSVTLTLLINSGAAILFLSQGFDHESIRSLQVFMGVLAISGLYFGVVVDENHSFALALLESKNKVERQVEQLSSLRRIDISILSTTDLGLILKALLTEATLYLKADLAYIHIKDSGSATLTYAAGTGERNEHSTHSPILLGVGTTGKAALARRTILLPDATAPDSSYDLQPMEKAEGVQAIFASPLVAKGKLLGTITAAFRAPFTPSDDWQSYFESLAGEAAIAINSATLFEDLQSSNDQLIIGYDETIEGWSRALDLRDKETEGHTQRVTSLAIQLARALGVEDRELSNIRRGALLHDIGKMGVPDSILHKPDKLSPEEWEIMKRHPQYAYELISSISYLADAVDIPYAHHEKWDGTGYPQGLKAEAIPFTARLFAVIDVYDALTSDRPYRKAWSKEKAFAYIKEQSGSHFDPRVVKAFLEMEGKTS